MGGVPLTPKFKFFKEATPQPSKGFPKTAWSMTNVYNSVPESTVNTQSMNAKIQCQG